MSALSPGNLFRSEKLQLTLDTPEQSAKAWTRWQRNSVMARMLDFATVQLFSETARRGLFEQYVPGDSTGIYRFHLHTLEDNRLIGFVELHAASFQHGDAWVAIAIGDSEDWNHEYGTDALRLLLAYAFEELGLHRVSLDVIAYNPRALRSYEKAGFRIEGIERAAIQREGQRFDIYVLGILQEEWAALQA